jgi:hypothetical protein
MSEEVKNGAANGTGEDLESQVASRTTKTKGQKKKAAKKAAKKTAGEKKQRAKKEGGVIDVIRQQIASDEGASVAEIQKALVKKFPDRDPEGMTTTIRIQMTRLPKQHDFTMKKTKDEKRGLVYKAPKSILKSAA